MCWCWLLPPSTWEGINDHLMPVLGCFFIFFKDPDNWEVKAINQGLLWSPSGRVHHFSKECMSPLVQPCVLYIHVTSCAYLLVCKKTLPKRCFVITTVVCFKLNFRQKICSPICLTCFTFNKDIVQTSQLWVRRQGVILLNITLCYLNTWEGTSSPLCAWWPCKSISKNSLWLVHPCTRFGS